MNNYITKIENPDLLKEMIKLLESKGIKVETCYHTNYLNFQPENRSAILAANDSHVVINYGKIFEGDVVKWLTPGEMLDKILILKNNCVSFNGEKYIILKLTTITFSIRKQESNKEHRFYNSDLDFFDKELAAQIKAIIN